MARRQLVLFRYIPRGTPYLKFGSGWCSEFPCSVDMLQLLFVAILYTIKICVIEKWFVITVLCCSKMKREN